VHEAPRRRNSDRRGIHRAEEPPARSLSRSPPCGGSAGCLEEECAAMDFGIYPPEINSGRMYTGPGSGPVMAAAQAWGSLADELYTAASAYQSVVSELTSGSWSGPSSTSMTAAAGT